MISYESENYIIRSNGDYKISIEFDHIQESWKLYFYFNSSDNKGDWLFISLPLKCIKFESGYWMVKDNVITNIITDFLDGKFNGHQELREKMNDTLMDKED